METQAVAEAVAARREVAEEVAEDAVVEEVTAAEDIVARDTAAEEITTAGVMQPAVILAATTIPIPMIMALLHLEVRAGGSGADREGRRIAVGGSGRVRR